MRIGSHKRVIEFIRAQGLARPRELARLGVPRTVLSELSRQGVLRRHGRGLYSVAKDDMSEQRSLAEVAKRVPKGVFCLLSALRFHDLTVQNPREIWIAIEGRAWKPKLDSPALRVFRFTGKAWSEGVERAVVDGVEVAVTNVAKTVADCFKFRNKVGLDVALEALHDAWRKRKLNTDELWHYAEICRVLKVIRPYLETLP
jgi:predicted transcriptional regulator of viral defense system